MCHYGDNNKGRGLYDANGVCIVPTNTQWCAYPNEHNTGIWIKPLSDNGNFYERAGGLTTSTHFNYEPYDDLLYAFTKVETQQNTSSSSNPATQEQEAQPGYYIPEGGTAPVPNGFKPDIIGVSKNGIVTVNGVERPDLTYKDGTYSSGSSSSSGRNKGHVTKAQLQQQINIVNKAEARSKANPSNHNARSNYEAAKQTLKTMQQNFSGK